MGDIRKADFVFLLKNVSNTNKIELFSQVQWGILKLPKQRYNRFRLRVNGKWYPNGREKVFYSKWQIRDMIFHSIHLPLN